MESRLVLWTSSYVRHHFLIYTFDCSDFAGNHLALIAALLAAAVSSSQTHPYKLKAKLDVDTVEPLSWR